MRIFPSLQHSTEGISVPRWYRRFHRGFCSGVWAHRRYSDVYFFEAAFFLASSSSFAFLAAAFLSAFFFLAACFFVSFSCFFSAAVGWFAVPVVDCDQAGIDSMRAKVEAKARGIHFFIKVTPDFEVFLHHTDDLRWLGQSRSG